MSPDLLLHHQKLDAQHAGLFGLLEAAAVALETGSAGDLLRGLAAFHDAMLEHTATEEAVMEETLFPDRERHRVAHEVFLADLQQLVAEAERTGPTPQVGEWLRVRVPEWLRFHIAVNDTKLGAHLAKRPASGHGARRADGRRTQS
jgi:hemerythrin-like metal-binding protein